MPTTCRTDHEFVESPGAMSRLQYLRREVERLSRMIEGMRCYPQGTGVWVEKNPNGIRLHVGGSGAAFFILAVDGTDVDIRSGPILRIRGAALSEFKVWGGDSLANGLPQTAAFRLYGLQFNLQQSIGAGNPEINASADHGDCSSVDNCWSDTDQGIKSSNNATGQADNDHFVTIPIGYADQDGILAQWQRDQILLPVYG